MFVAGLAALVVAQAGGTNAPLRMPMAFDCVAMPMLMSAQGDGSVRRAVRTRIVVRPRPATRCFRLSAR